ncbi:MAG: hypothetical protein ABJD11_03220 [Gemmatimonadota bacterium]
MKFLPALALLLSFAPAPACAQRAREFGLQSIVTVSHSTFGGGGLYAALRLGERARVAGLAWLGGSEGHAIGRGEVLGNFLLSPSKSRGVGWYGIGGVAWAGGQREQGYVVLGLGIESRPGASSGWAVEAGVGGGFRTTAGYRWRWFARRPGVK